MLPHSGSPGQRVSISVIIPTLNEEDWLGATLDSLTNQPEPWEIIVSDAGSTDATRRIAETAATIVSSDIGRARQMNAGALAANGTVLLFVHADTRLDPNAFAAVRRALRNPAVQAGAFQLRFDKAGFWPGLYALCARVHWHRVVFGDRGLFVRRTAFEAVGGFPEVPILEDQMMVHNLHLSGAFAYLPIPATTAWRRFAAHGPIRQQVRNLYVMAQFLLGRPPHKIRHDYPARRQVSQRS